MFGGRNRARTYDPLLVRQMLSQLSYTPKHLKCISTVLFKFYIIHIYLSIHFLIFYKVFLLNQQNFNSH